MTSANQDQEGPGRTRKDQDWLRDNQLMVISCRSFAVSTELDMEPFVDADKSVIVSHFHRPTSSSRPSPPVCQPADGRKSDLDAAFFLLTSQKQTGKAQMYHVGAERKSADMATQ